MKINMKTTIIAAMLLISVAATAQETVRGYIYSATGVTNSESAGEAHTGFIISRGMMHLRLGEKNAQTTYFLKDMEEYMVQQSISWWTVGTLNISEDKNGVYTHTEYKDVNMEMGQGNGSVSITLRHKDFGYIRNFYVIITGYE